MIRNSRKVRIIYLYFANIILSFFFLPRCIYATQPIKGSSSFYVFQDKKTQYYGIKTASGSVLLPARYNKIYTTPGAEPGAPVFVDAPYDMTKEAEYSLPAMIAVMRNGRIWWVDPKGKELFESFFFDNGPDYFVKGLSRIIKGDKFGFIDKKGYIVIQPQYDFASPFDKDYFANVCQGCWLSYPPDTKFPIAHFTVPCDRYGDIVGGKWGIISSTGQVVVPLQYNSDAEARRALKKAK